MTQKSFDALTDAGKRQRLTQLAHRAIAHFPIEVARLRFLAQETNLLFRIDARDGVRYALRICAPGEHSLEDRALEVTWLDALARETDLNVARPVATRDGGFTVTVTHPGVNGERVGMLFAWIPGKQGGEYSIDAAWAPALGEAMAKLHRHARGFALPPGAQPMRWDRTFYYVHQPTVVYEASHAHLFTAEDIDNIRMAQMRIDATIAVLWARAPGPHLIHTDLHGGNTHVHKGNLWLFDFEDVALGVAAQDIASALYPARFCSAEYADIVAAFRRGYERVSEWPLRSDDELETLIAARVLMFVNYCANGYEKDEDLRRSLSKLLNRVAAFAARGS
jgi:Ser/Thr protein kinase RdoA (MazF antagonist)